MGILLTESRKEDLKKKYANKFDNEVLDFVLGISDLQDFNHKYTDFILKALEPETDIDFWVDIAVGLVKDFDKYQSQLKKKDINQYSTFSELEDALTPFQEKEKEKELEKQANKIYEDDKFLVIKPKTEEASCKYGSNTKWCVTSKGSGHFEKYIQDRQSLYFIINKTNSTNKNYSKVAIHFDNEGYPKYWDSQDSPMSEREVDVLNYAFPEIIDSINQDYKIHFGSASDRFLKETFDTSGRSIATNKKYLNSNYNLESSVSGFENLSDIVGHAEGHLRISLWTNDEYKIVDSYQIYITYKSKDKKYFTASIGFAGTDEVPGDDYEDLELEGWGIDVTYNIGKSPAETADGVRNHIANRVLIHIQNNPKLVQKVAGTSKVWRADRANYGYTFGKNKGFIKKLVDYLDNGSIGTKLDFLESLGKLKTKVVDGKKLYSRSDDNYVPSSKFRGQFSSFFASAKMAGILGYRKVGKDFLLIKGPNFDAFKSGELKAL